MTYEEHKRIKAQIIKGEESLSSHYNLDDNGTARALIDTCIKIIQDDDAIINCLEQYKDCLLYTSPSPRDRTRSRMPSSA